MKGLEEMTREEGAAWCDDMHHLMNLWDECRAAWIERFGTEIGFDKWFAEKTEGKI